MSNVKLKFISISHEIIHITFKLNLFNSYINENLLLSTYKRIYSSNASMSYEFYCDGESDIETFYMDFTLMYQAIPVINSLTDVENTYIHLVNEYNSERGIITLIVICLPSIAMHIQSNGN